jgi:hypothetical protein
MSERRSRQSRKRKNAIARKKAIRRSAPAVTSDSSSDSATMTADTRAIRTIPRTKPFSQSRLMQIPS